MKKSIKIVIGIIIVAVSIAFFLNTNFYIAKQAWKYREGAHVGDWVEFNKGYTQLKGRNIYKNGERVAVIRFCMGKLLVIRSLKTGEFGYYINKT
jgi:hypothetical protein